MAEQAEAAEKRPNGRRIVTYRILKYIIEYLQRNFNCSQRLF
ncbi:hypothetical protein HMPREF1548_00448 [Clostridium sp. KLE 1755]|nr:hypothetical protein HMPREF1548_00448 [Clostridium sp. KLE 1755]